VAGTEFTCVVGDKYISVSSIQVQTAPCGTPATPTSSPMPSQTPTPVPTMTPTLPPGVTPTVTPPPGGNLALGKAVFASSAPDPAYPPPAAVDGDPNTYWASIPDPQPIWDVPHLQWFYVDLGATYQVKSMRMLWVTGRNPRVYAVYVWRDSWRAWQWVARTEYGKVDDPVTFPYSVEGRYFMLWLQVPEVAGSQYELREWEIGSDTGSAVQATNVAAGRASIALSHEPGYEAGKATDADLTTEWRSSTGLPQWLYVDLGTEHRIDRAILRWVAGMHATSYTLYAWNGASWQAVYTTTHGAGGDETVAFAAVETRYLLVYAAAGPAANVGLREFEVYEVPSSGGLPFPLSVGASTAWSWGPALSPAGAPSLGWAPGQAAVAEDAAGLGLLDGGLRPPMPGR
jgi:hypothetical protein